MSGLVYRSILLFSIAASASAQSAPPIQLRPADAKLPAEFTQIRAIRELADGRVLLTDWKETRFVVADFRSGKAETVARKGSGPGEFQIAGPLVALPGDSTYMIDPLARRWLLVVGSKVTATLSAETPVIKSLGGESGELLGADKTGYVLTSRFPLARNGKSFNAADSLWLLRVQRSSGKTDTIGRLRSRYERGHASGMGEISIPPIAVGDQAILFADGWVAFARLDPYLVEWRSPDGRVVRGSPLPFTPVRVNDGEKQAYRDRLVKQGGQAGQYGDVGWPEKMPPFDSHALFATPDGRLLVHRMPTASNPAPRYDLVDRRGALVGTLALNDGQQVIGFGAKSIYIVVTDDDGIQRLQRHPWP